MYTVKLKEGELRPITTLRSYKWPCDCLIDTSSPVPIWYGSEDELYDLFGKDNVTKDPRTYYYMLETEEHSILPTYVLKAFRLADDILIHNLHIFLYENENAICDMSLGAGCFCNLETHLSLPRGVLQIDSAVNYAALDFTLHRRDVISDNDLQELLPADTDLKHISLVNSVIVQSEVQFKKMQQMMAEFMTWCKQRGLDSQRIYSEVLQTLPEAIYKNKAMTSTMRFCQMWPAQKSLMESGYGTR